MDVHAVADISGRIIVAVCIIFLIVYFLQSMIDAVISWEFIGLIVGIMAGSALHAWGSTRGNVTNYQMSHATALPNTKSD